MQDAYGPYLRPGNGVSMLYASSRVVLCYIVTRLAGVACHM